MAVGEYNHLSRTMHLLKSIICCFIILSIHLGFEMLIIHGLLLLFVTPLKFITNYTKIVNTCAFLHTYVSKINMAMLKYLKKYYNDLSSSTDPLLLWFLLWHFLWVCNMRKIYGPGLFILLLGRKIVHQANSDFFWIHIFQSVKRSLSRC